MLFFRPSIFLDIKQSTENFDTELEWLLEHLKTPRKKIIVYVHSINFCYQIFMYLVTNLMEKSFVDDEPSTKNRKIEMFHANTDTESKNRILEEFTKADSNIKVLISTVAFGMGVNITDIDIVVHWGLPTSPLSYWQEVGRCSRDGRNGYAVCYAYKRSYCKLKEDDDFRKVTSLDTYIRVSILKNFLLKGMDHDEYDKLKTSSCCDNDCESPCKCLKCLCCVICQKQCACKGKAEEPLTKFLRD
jgi:ATP-dependent DNA helicase RecQ